MKLANILTRLKKHFNLILLCFCALMLTGCATVEYSRLVYPSGRVTDQVVISIDSGKLIANGYNPNTLLTHIKNDLEILYVSNVRTFISESMLNDKLSVLEKQEIYGNIKSSVEVVSNEYKVVATIIFENQNVFNKYYEWRNKDNPPANEEDNETQLPSNVEVIKTPYLITFKQTSNHVYGNVVSGDLAPIYNKYANTLTLGNKFSVNDTKFIQIYGSPNLRIQSNALDTEINSGIKLHYWEIDPLNENQKLEFYTYTPNQITWYITAVAVAIIVAIFVIAYNILNREPYFKQKVDYNK